jgi:hypothetical protein
VQSRGTSTWTIGFKPIDFQTVRLVVLTIITIVVLAEPTTNTSRRHRVDVRDHTGVCSGRIKIKLDVTTIQIECCLSGSSTIALNAPAAVLKLHTITISHNKIAGVWAVHISCHSSEDVGHEGCLHILKVVWLQSTMF